jgi:hypothetical protein
MFTFVELGIFVAVGNVLILKVKKKIDQVFKVAFCFIQILSQNTNMKDYNLSCTPAEIREIAKNTVANLLPDKS